MARKRLQNHHAKNAGFDPINTAVFKQSAFVKPGLCDRSSGVKRNVVRKRGLAGMVRSPGW
jgi:hypothetical protein